MSGTTVASESGLWEVLAGIGWTHKLFETMQSQEPTPNVITKVLWPIALFETTQSQEFTPDVITFNSAHKTQQHVSAGS